MSGGLPGSQPSSGGDQAETDDSDEVEDGRVDEGVEIASIPHAQAK
jgi:hypothetical protein